MISRERTTYIGYVGRRDSTAYQAINNVTAEEKTKKQERLHRTHLGIQERYASVFETQQPATSFERFIFSVQHRGDVKPATAKQKSHMQGQEHRTRRETHRPTEMIVFPQQELDRGQQLRLLEDQVVRLREQKRRGEINKKEFLEQREALVKQIKSIR